MGVKNLKQMLLAAGLGLLWWFPAGAFMAWAGADADTLCVRPDGGGGCFSTIQEAVDVAVDGDEILIAAGTYTENVIITRDLALTGGWQPAGWVLSETVVLADEASCALTLNSVAGRVENMTVEGSDIAGLCGYNLDDFTLDNFISRKNQGDGVFITAGGDITISHSLFVENVEHGLNLDCAYAGSPLRNLIINDSQAIGNGLNGFDGGGLGDRCDYAFEHILAATNGENGLGGFFSACPTESIHKLKGVYTVDIIESEFFSNTNGIHTNCGNEFFLSRNYIHHNHNGLMVNESGMNSENNLIVDNKDTGIILRAAYWAGINDTVDGNGRSAFVLKDDMTGLLNLNRSVSACDNPVLKLTNSIVWGESPAITWDYNEFCLKVGGIFSTSLKYSLVSGLDLLVDEPNIIEFYIGPAVYDLDPFFVGNGDYRLRSPSLAIDGGTEEDAPLVDIMGNPRPVDGNGDGTAQSDMGAYESSLQPFNIVFLPQASNLP